MPTYIKDRAVAYGCLEELKINPRFARSCPWSWDIIVIAQMPQKGIIMKMKAGVILGQQLAIQADSVGYCSGYYKARSASGRASGEKYKARIVIFCILFTVNRFSRISRKAKSC